MTTYVCPICEERYAQKKRRWFCVQTHEDAGDVLEEQISQLEKDLGRSPTSEEVEALGNELYDAPTWE